MGGKAGVGLCRMRAEHSRPCRTGCVSSSAWYARECQILLRSIARMIFSLSFSNTSLSILPRIAVLLLPLKRGFLMIVSRTSSLAASNVRWSKTAAIRYVCTVSSRSDLRAIARELGITGRSRMNVQALIEAIERLDPKRFEAWEKLVYGSE